MTITTFEISHICQLIEAHRGPSPANAALFAEIEALAVPFADADINDGPKRCPECETPNQFGELCGTCRREEADELTDISHFLTRQAIDRAINHKDGDATNNDIDNLEVV